MPSIRPFTGLLYDSHVAGPLDLLTTPPYDAITPRERQRYLAMSPFNVVRLIKAGGTRDQGDGGRGAADRYERAALHLASWRAAGVLAPTTGPAMYPYEFTFHHDGRPRVLRGLIASVDLEPFGRTIIPHERTMPGPLEDRLALIRAVRANLSPIYAVLEGPSPVLTAFLDSATRTPPAGETTDEAGTRHRIWVFSDAVDAVAAAVRDEVLMVADGHHRYTVALAHREEMRAHHGAGPWDSMMMLMVDAGTEDPPVLPIHRLVRDAPTDPEHDAWDRGERVRDLAEVLAAADDHDLVIGVIRPGSASLDHRIVRLDGSPPAVRALHHAVLHGVRPGRVRFVTDAVAAEEAVRRGRATTAYILPATHVDRVREVVRTGGRLPEKSTFFWPKPRTGMVIRPLDA
jgi:uncharacterized protein (DUF1015 family)